MPTYAKVLTDTYLPAQAAKLRWESAKTVAGAQFDALAEQRKAVDEVRLRRQQYAENIRIREGSADAFMFQAMQAQAGVQPPGGGGGGGGAREVVDAGVSAIRALPGSTVFKTGSAEEQLVRNTFNAAKSVEQKQRVIDAAVARGFEGSLVIPAGTLSEKVIGKKAREGDAAAQAQYLALVGRAQATIDLADNLGERGFQGGLQGREFYENLTGDQQELARVYASALLDDGVVTAEEVPEGRLEEARKLHGKIEAKGAYRRENNKAFDQGYLELLKDLKTKEASLAEAEGRLQGKTKETLAEELYSGASERAAIPPLLRSLEPEMKGFLDGYTGALASDPKTDPESYLKSKLTDREAKGFSAASAMAASGMRAADIMDNLRALNPEERRKVMGALASRDAIASTQMKVAPGTPLPEIQKIQTEDRRAQEAELARTESRLQRRLREIDESLAAGRESGFGGIVSPDTGARRAPVDPRREVLMGALSPEEAAAQARLSDEAEVERIAAERDRERDRTAAFKRTADADMLETPEEVAAVEEFRRRQAAQPGQRLRLPAPAAPSTRLSPEERLRLEAVDAAAREAAFLQYGRAPDERSRGLIRETMMRALTPTPSVGPTRADLRPEPFEFDQLEPAPVLVPEEVPEPEPVPDQVFKKVYNPATGKIELIEVK